MKSATWKLVHGELVRLAKSKGAYDAEEARWLLEGKRVRVHEPLVTAPSSRCSAHHMQIHDGALHVSGTAPFNLVFRRRHPTWPERATSTADTSPASNHVCKEALHPLRGLGFSAAEARRAVESSSLASPDADLETLLRQSLGQLHPSPRASRASQPTARYGASDAETYRGARASRRRAHVLGRTEQVVWIAARLDRRQSAIS